MTEANGKRPQLKIYRAADAPDLMATGNMTVEPFSDEQRAGIDKAIAAGYLEGDQVKVLTEMPGFSITYAWFKKSYPLARHSHDADCMYYVVAGSLRLGTEELGPRDCFFVPADAPYTYTPGPDGVEILEFRHKTTFNFINLSHGESFWNKAAETCTANREDWKTAAPPSSK